jgi:hypothetical protein
MPEAGAVAALLMEWRTLQQDFEQCEQRALWLKLAAILMCFAAFALAIDLLLVMVLLGVIWLQEAIVRTGQARLGARLLEVESLLKHASPPLGAACQLHASWQAARAGAASLLAEYAKNAMRPTVAFPYVVLTLLIAAVLLQAGA